MFMGFGSDHVRKIATNEVGKMRLSDLEEQVKLCLENGWQPLMVSATAGTTVLGAFDDLAGISEVCKKYNMWMHVDAAWVAVRSCPRSIAICSMASNGEFHHILVAHFEGKPKMCILAGLIRSLESTQAAGCLATVFHLPDAPPTGAGPVPFDQCDILVPEGQVL